MYISTAGRQLSRPARHKVPTRLQRVAPERRATIPGGHPAIPARQESGFAPAGACGRARRWTVWGVAWHSARAFPWQGDRFNRSRAERACVWHRPRQPERRRISLGHIEFDVGSKALKLSAAGACATVMRAEPRWGADAQQIGNNLFATTGPDKGGRALLQFSLERCSVTCQNNITGGVRST